MIRPNKVILAVAFGLVALASLIDACGDETALTACELVGALASNRGRPGPEKEALWTASAKAFGCELPDMSNGRPNFQGTSQIPPIPVLHDLEAI